LLFLFLRILFLINFRALSNLGRNQIFQFLRY
jgi:hypothetical protein